MALLAVQVGEELALPPHRLRDLAIGGLLHDIGKLSVPDRILKKPGRADRGRVRSRQAPSGAWPEAPRRPRRLHRPGARDSSSTTTSDSVGTATHAAFPRRDLELGHADPHGLRRLRRLDLAARLPIRVVARPGDRAVARGVGHGVRPPLCCRPRAGARPRLLERPRTRCLNRDGEPKPPVSARGDPVCAAFPFIP